MFHVCELRQRLPEDLRVPNNTGAAQMEWSKENRLDLLRSAKKWPRLGPASRRNLNGLRLLTTPRQPEHFYYRASEAVLLKLVLWNCSGAALHAFVIIGGK